MTMKKQIDYLEQKISTTSKLIRRTPIVVGASIIKGGKTWMI